MDEFIKRGDEEGILRLSKELDMDRKFGNEAQAETYTAEFFSSDLINRIVILFSAAALVFFAAQIYFLEIALSNTGILNTASFDIEHALAPASQCLKNDVRRQTTPCLVSSI